MLKQLACYLRTLFISMLHSFEVWKNIQIRQDLVKKKKKKKKKTTTKNKQTNKQTNLLKKSGNCHSLKCLHQEEERTDRN